MKGIMGRPDVYLEKSEKSSESNGIYGFEGVRSQ